MPKFDMPEDWMLDPQTLDRMSEDLSVYGPTMKKAAETIRRLRRFETVAVTIRVNARHMGFSEAEIEGFLDGTGEKSFVQAMVDHFEGVVK